MVFDMLMAISRPIWLLINPKYFKYLKEIKIKIKEIKIKLKWQSSVKRGRWGIEATRSYCQSAL